MAAESLNVSNAEAGSEGQGPPAGPPQAPPQAQGPMPLPTPPGTSGSPPRAPARTARKLPFSPINFVLVGLFGAGIFGVYLLSLRTGLREASAEERTVEAQVEAALAQMDAAQTTDPTTDESAAVIDTLYYEVKQRQIPLEQLAGNPFIYVPPSSENKGLTPEQLKGISSAQIQQQEELSIAMASVRNLELQTVLTGEKGATAIISNNLVSEGQTINGWTVKNIGPKEVILKWKGHEYVLKMPR